MSGTYFINENCLLVSLLSVKKEYLDIDYLERSEVNIFKTFISDFVKAEHRSIRFTEGVMRSYFNEIDGVIRLNADIEASLDELRNHFRNLGPSNEVIPMIWDNEFVYENLFEKKNNKDNISKISLDVIIEKIMDNPSEFYSKVGKELTAEEYSFLADKIIDKSCDNCMMLCDNKLDGCNNWKNDVMVGKMKVLTK